MDEPRIEWQFEDVESILREDAEAKGGYDANKPFARLDKDAVKRARIAFGCATWGKFAAVAHVSESTAKDWRPCRLTRGTVVDTVFPALCETACSIVDRVRICRPYARGHADRTSVERRVAYALLSGSDRATPEDAAEELTGAWERYDAATLLFACFNLANEDLRTVANVARAVMAASRDFETCEIIDMSGIDFSELPSNGPSQDAATVQELEDVSGKIERAAIDSVPLFSRGGLDLPRMKSLVEENASAKLPIEND